VIGVGRDYGEQEASAGLAVVNDEFRLKQNAYLIPYAGQFVAHMAAYRRDGQADKGSWLGDLDRIEANRGPAQ
jgi:hypothetical protein